MSGSENSGDLLQNIAAGSFSTQNNGNTIPKLSFTQKEIDKMPKTFKKEFRVDGSAARVILYDLRTTFYTRLKECRDET